MSSVSSRFLLRTRSLLLSGVGGIFATATLLSWSTQARSQEVASQAQPTDAVTARSMQDETTEPSSDTQSITQGDIVVTANRREQSLQRVGISVSALSGETLRRANISSTEDIAAVTPGFQFQASNSGSLTGLISIRGVSQSDFAGHIESPNPLYVDEVYMPATSSNTQKTYDVSRIEVLRGPQGTLFGRNATGGLLHIITNKPTDRFEGYAQASYGSFNLVNFEAAINLPISDTVAIRVSGIHNQSDGYFKNNIGPDMNADNTDAARIHIKIDPTPDLHILLSGEIYDLNTDRTGAAYAVAAAVGPNGLGINLPSGTPITYFGLFPAYTPSRNPYEGGWDDLGSTKRRVYNAGSNIAYDLGNVTLSSITSYNSVKTSYFEDNDNTSRPWLTFFQNSRSKAFTQELRLHGTFGATHITVGAYYLNINGDYQQSYRADFRGLVGDFVFPDAIYALKTKSLSGFFQVEQTVTDRLKLTGGLRYTTDHKEYAYRQTCQPSLAICQALGLNAAGGIGAFTATNGTLSDDHREGGLSARAQIDFQATPDWLLYTSFNLGYKAFNYNAGFAGNAPLAGFRFKGEHLYAYEAGSKMTLWSGMANLNISAYYYDYRDYQAFDQRGVNFTLFNTDAVIYGGEAVASIRPGAGFTLAGGISLLHTEVKNVPIGNQLVTREASQSPKFTFDGSIRKDFSFAWGNIGAQFNAAYTGQSYAQLSNAPNTRIPSNWLANARIGYTTVDERYEVSLFAKNLFDATRFTYSYDVSLFGFTKYNVAPPRIIGVQARYVF